MRDYEKIRKYWESHSVADEWDKLEDADIEFEHPKKIGVSLRIDKEVIDEIKKQAEQKGLGYTAYIRSVLTQLARNKRVKV